jgi:hypothetical protein
MKEARDASGDDPILFSSIYSRFSLFLFPYSNDFLALLQNSTRILGNPHSQSAITAIHACSFFITLHFGFHLYRHSCSYDYQPLSLSYARLFISLTSLHDKIQARIVQEMLHGLFHAFISFDEYERLTGGKWGTGGCRCRQCARRVPRVLVC